MDKSRGRPFPPGNTFGRGRPKGSRNREKSAGQRVLDEFAPHLYRKCIAQAMQGDASSMRLCMERISPVRRGASIRMTLPSTRTAQDVDRAAEMVMRATNRGELTPNEGATMMGLLEDRARVIKTVQMESRLEKLEEESKVSNDEGHGKTD